MDFIPYRLFHCPLEPVAYESGSFFFSTTCVFAIESPSLLPLPTKTKITSIWTMAYVIFLNIRLPTDAFSPVSELWISNPQINLPKLLLPNKQSLNKQYINIQAIPKRNPGDVNILMLGYRKYPEVFPGPKNIIAIATPNIMFQSIRNAINLLISNLPSIFSSFPYTPRMIYYNIYL